VAELLQFDKFSRWRPSPYWTVIECYQTTYKATSVVQRSSGNFMSISWASFDFWDISIFRSSLKHESPYFHPLWGGFPGLSPKDSQTLSRPPKALAGISAYRPSSSVKKRNLWAWKRNSKTKLEMWQVMYVLRPPT